MKGLPYWEKKILAELKLDGLVNIIYCYFFKLKTFYFQKNNCYNIIKNIPEINQRLWKVKHVLKIVPITFPDGFPGQNDHTILKENGELRIIKQVNALEERLQLREEFKKNVKLLDGDTLRRDSRKKWLNAWDTTC